MPTIFERLRESRMQRSIQVDKGQDEGVVANLSVVTGRKAADTAEGKAALIEAIRHASADPELEHIGPDLAEALIEWLALDQSDRDQVNQVLQGAGALPPHLANNPLYFQAMQLAKLLNAQKERQKIQALEVQRRRPLRRILGAVKSFFDLRPEGFGKLPYGYKFR